VAAGDQWTSSLRELLAAGGFEAAKELTREGQLAGATIDALLFIAREDPVLGEPAIYALSFGRVRRRHAARVVRSLIAILEDKQLVPAVRAQAPEGIGVHLPDKQRALRRSAVTSLTRQLRDHSPEVRFWSAFGLALLGARESRHEIRRLLSDTAFVDGWWTVGEEASDVLDILEGRDPPERVPIP
jgi:HEAT repeat protein